MFILQISESFRRASAIKIEGLNSPRHIPREGNVMSIIEEIDSHEQEVLSGLQPEGLNSCPACNTRPCTFHLHESRYRIFYVIIECFVLRKESCLGRWKCVSCEKTFTYYPYYALPFKRYVKGDMVLFCQKYLTNDNATYVSAATFGSATIAYTNSKDEKVINERTFTGSTIWRWVQCFGSLEKLLKKGLDLIRQKDVTSTIFRKVWLVKKSKYKTNERKTLLEKCLKLFDAENEYKKLFKISLFPDLAIKYP